MGSENRLTWNQSELDVLCEHPCPPGKVSELKRQFDNVVNSQRTLDRIDDVRKLLEVLRKRDELTETRLLEIAQIVDFRRVRPALTTITNERYQTREARSNTARSRIRNDELTDVYELIKRKLGVHWIDFARAIDMQEVDIDRLQKCHDTGSIIVKVLEQHERNCDPHDWRKRLLAGMEAARRKDLSNDVAAELDRYGIIDHRQCYS